MRSGLNAYYRELCGGGYNNIAVSEAKERRIIITNTPGVPH